MKLLYIANLRLPTEKAYGIQIAKTCEAIASLGHDVLLVCPFRINKIKEDFFKYYSLERKFKLKRIWAPDFYLPGKLDKVAVNIKNFISAVLLCFYVLTHKADIIYTRDEWPAYILSFFKMNIIFEAHKFYPGKRMFYKRFVRNNYKTITISNGLKKDLLSFGFSDKNLLVAPDGVDLKEFDLSMTKEEPRKKVGLPLDKKIVMYTGHLFEWKGANALLAAARKSQTKINDILFVFVGGTENDVKEFKKKAEGLDDVLILGHRPHKDIPAYLKAADVLVLPNSAKEEISSKYTSPLKLFEYMASSRPIVASDLPSLRDVLNESNCFFAKPDDQNDLAKTILKVLHREQSAKEISDKAHEDVKNYTWQKRAEKITKFVNV